MNAPARGRGVLVVDDDKDIRDTVAEILRDEGYEVLCAANGAQALEMLTGGYAPGLVLLDLMMPVMSGWEMLEYMQATPQLAALPVVVVSAMGAPGTSGHLGKPFDIESLLRTVAHFVRCA